MTPERLKTLAEAVYGEELDTDDFFIAGSIVYLGVDSFEPIARHGQRWEVLRWMQPLIDTDGEVDCMLTIIANGDNEALIEMACDMAEVVK